MTTVPNVLEMPKLKRPSLNPMVLAGIVVAIAVIGAVAVTRFIGAERERELLIWQNRLSLIADSREADIEAWLDRQYTELGKVAANPSTQLYAAELIRQPEGTAIAVGEEPAQLVFLRNMLSMTADRLGFVQKESAELKSITADVRKPGGVGIAIADLGGKILAGTEGLPVLDGPLAQRVQQVPKGQVALIDVFTDDSGKARMGFVVPIFPVQAEGSEPMALLIATRRVDNDVFKLLKHPGVTEQSLEAVLLRKAQDNVEYLSPQAEGAASQLALSTPDLDAAYALSATGTFSIKKNAASKTSLMTSRAIAKSPWVLMLHIDRDQALGDSDLRLRQIAFSLFFALLAMIGGIVAVWYYGTSKRTRLLSLETQRMAAKSAAQEKLLRVVADNQIEPIIIADESNTVRFANAKAARTFHMTTGEVGGKSLSALMGQAQAKGYEEANKISLSRSAPYFRSWANEKGLAVTHFRSEHIPLPHIPVEGLPIPTPGVLMIDQDITEIVNEREHRMRILRQLIDMLVMMVDRRDPYAASHSACVAIVARDVAANMGLDAARVETAETAGRLMNIGKIVVPSEVLTKPSALTDSEKKSIQESLQQSIALLEKIEFDGPVVDTLRQAQEKFDGSGPMHLRGEDILITARIIAVVNAFIGMISVRSYRQALGVDQAIKTLLSQIDTQFDRRVVVALADYVDNKKGRETLKKIIPTEPSV